MQPAIDDPHALLATEIRFGPFRVFPGRRLLERQGTPVAIGGRALDLLVALLSRPGQILSKRELLQRVWPDTIVEEGSLRFHMTHLRRILGDDGATGGRYIATQVGVGYAFVAPVARVQAGVGDADPGAGDPAPPPPVRSALAALPTRPALIGRSADAKAVLGSLQEPRLVTIVGSGGVGKTSLAVDVGHAADYDVVRFVDLAQIEDATLVASALAAAWGVPVQADDPVFVLQAHLQDARALLIIDNCEHLVEAVCAIVERLREAAPGVCVLATSREPLRARGEQLYWLGPLECPPADAQLSAPALMAYPAVRLFIERASLDDRQAPLEAEQLRLIADICLRLDGMALPIELAAVRRPRMASRQPKGCWANASRWPGPVVARHCRGSRRSARPWTGAMACSPARKSCCSTGWRSSLAGFRCMRPARWRATRGWMR
ncbi:ATP-binding protein [Stenotrophomonas sp. NPDC077464]|uniref:ATP-binding protein n=1 Tax=unclassified Stenotrophomonas TaxID=196198 RepID=UPI0037D049AD